MLFHVQSEDAPGAEDLMIEQAEEHWSYMDRFTDSLVLRGPLLSDDGEHHAGSVHIVEADDRAAAERFAAEEPYWKGGLYREFTVDRIVVERHGEIAREQDMTLVTARWDARPRDERRDLQLVVSDELLAFAGLLVDDAAELSTGCVAVVRSLAEADVQGLLDQLGTGAGARVGARRWCRGGRN
ncbi:YciI family protein [Streptomyces sp. NPDC050418]|uniref:YciI family protein n=1 Tax=Streptomyces sp. NPDC050418 TaxID=3365612 RepID=UPI00378D498A